MTFTVFTRKNWLMTLFALLLLQSATGCTPVEAWERGNLAKSHMALDPRPEANALTAHVYGSREAAGGSNSTSGGGCGCY